MSEAKKKFSIIEVEHSIYWSWAPIYKKNTTLKYKTNLRL